jgi:hypothetical protein
LLGKTGLDSLQVQKLWAELESHWKFLVKLLVVIFELHGMLSLELSEGLSILLLSLEEIIVPLLVELVILLDMCLLTLISLLSLVEDQLILLSLIVLIFKF